MSLAKLTQISTAWRRLPFDQVLRCLRIPTAPINDRQLIDGAHRTVEPLQRAGHPAATTQFSLVQRLCKCLCLLSRGICRGMQHWDGAAILRSFLVQCRNRALRTAILARLNIQTHDRTILGRWCPSITESQQLRGRRAGFARRASSHGRAVMALVEAVGDGKLDSGVL